LNDAFKTYQSRATGVNAQIKSLSPLPGFIYYQYVGTVGIDGFVRMS